MEETKGSSTKTVPTKTILAKSSPFINRHSIIDNCQYLPDKTLTKAKTFIAITYHKYQIKRSFTLKIQFKMGNEFQELDIKIQLKLNITVVTTIQFI